MGKPQQVNGNTYRDDEYQDVKLEKIGSNLYKITNEGQYKDKVIYYDLDAKAYYETDPHEKYGFLPNANKFAISQVSPGPVVQAKALTEYDDIGEKGKGVGFVEADTTLRTYGLLTCVGWLLYNDKAAYLTHILVEHPKDVVADGSIKIQVAALCKTFSDTVGSLPTHVIIKVSTETHEYDDETGVWGSAWMQELVPLSCEVEWIRDEGILEHVVEASAGTRKEWDGVAIKVKYKVN